MTSLTPTFGLADTSRPDFVSDAYARAAARVARSLAPPRGLGAGVAASSILKKQNTMKPGSGTVWEVLRTFPRFAAFAAVLERGGLATRLDSELSRVTVLVPEFVDADYFAANGMLAGAHVLPVAPSLDYIRENQDVKFKTVYAPSHTIKFSSRGDGALFANGSHEILQHIPASNGNILVVAGAIVPDVIL